MALLFSDGFDSYAASADLLKKWARFDSPWIFDTSADQNGATNGIISAATTGGGQVYPRFSAGGVSRIGIGFWLKVSAAPANADFFFIANSINSTLGYFRLIATTGLITFLNSGSGTVTTGITNVCDNAWHWIEISFQIGTTVNRRCMVDSTSQWNGNFTSAVSGAIDRFYFQSLASRTTSISDIMCYDDNGLFTVTTNFPLGARKITTRRPDGDDAVQFTRSTGSSSFALVDEVNGDTTDYVESGTVGQQDTYDYAALGFTPTTVNAVMVNSFLANSSAGMSTHAQVAKSAGVLASGADVITPSAPFVRQQPFYVDPNTAAAWTEAGINAAKFGIKVATYVAINSQRFTSWWSTVSDGNRTSLITVTTDATIGNGPVNKLVDGSAAASLFWSGGQVNRNVTFDFGVGATVIIDGFGWLQDVGFNHGTWVLQGSNDNTTYTQIGAAFGLGVSGQTQMHYVFVNATPYRYYRLLQIAGTTSNSPFLIEIYFRATLVATQRDSYESGDRTGNIIVTTTATPQAGSSAMNLVNGDYAPDTTGSFLFNAVESTREFKFNLLGVQKIITDFVLLQSAATAHGTWVMEGSNNDSSYTQLGSSFTLGGSTVSKYSLSNSTAYSFYKLRQTAGSTGVTVRLIEIEFKIA